ncbi:hypothetical protein C0J52_18646 [Blattella germanica]|nr:hypothetical protein C0J52_18646 [Blattella germanica]
MILNAYAAVRKDFPSYTIDQCVTKTAKILFVSKATVYRIKAEWKKKIGGPRSLGPIHQLPSFPLQERKKQHRHARKR